MSSVPVRRVSRQDIQLVQNLIERCLQLYMNQKEVVETLLEQAKIEPGFTELVWQKLEEENQEFFKAYYLRLLLKKQIIEYNDLLLKQVRLTNQLRSQVAPLPTSNGPHISQLHQNPAGYAAGHRPENVQHPIGSGLPNVYNNGGLPNVYNNGESSPKTRMLAAAEISGHTNAIDGLPNFISAQSSNMGMVQGINGSLIKSESESLYSGNSPYMFGADGNVLGTRPPIGDASVTPFTNVESNAHPLNDSPLDLDTSTFGYLGQIRRNFSLSDLAADFTQSSGILESYTRSPFIATDNQNFFDSRGREYKVEHHL